MGAVKDGRSYGCSATAAIIFAQLFGIAAITLMLVWLLHFREGVALSSTVEIRLLNIHHLLMFLGLVYSGGQAIIAFKAIPATRRVQKFFHGLLHLVAIALGALGLYAVFKFNRDLGIPDLKSLHSWLGIATISLYSLQLVVGLMIFMFPGASFTTRGSYLPWHAFFGLIIFMMAICTAETGLMERFAILRLYQVKEGLIVNFTGLAILLYGMSIILSVILP
ncbi:probable ascorbate-specific transmembrane electron transporter 1 [Dioscorea cayenensis subsp. rotundata]|uniref:Probable ascorbate-specific transmembrane electron transporter 1 n=1 Tax=Dioscorea cayennensis subsp. rotundata TaxID=55577 RepID=A0AB40D3A5_DIOCR|nr:probable ascorbate-specific transmembrane electron transporter 1 [Dioscorea cayenensis subsp. rotundata]